MVFSLAFIAALPFSRGRLPQAILCGVLYHADPKRAREKVRAGRKNSPVLITGESVMEA
jgi:hypothetical protein